MHLYLCPACLTSRHAACERARRTPHGHYGGSLCLCPCKGDAAWEEKRAAAAKSLLPSAPSLDSPPDSL